ncbi:MAG: hypothetical protein KGP28_01295 [Bdellovibrionales bacterium]|nr:hypothetical protein [Bdellovibrionales bacterium]
MAPLKNAFFRKLSILLLLSFTGCAEMRALVTVLFSKSTALSTSAFEFDEIHSGEGVVCASFADKSLRCLGSGNQGNLGTFNSAPVDIEAPIKSVATGKGFTCVISGVDSKLFCFGTNDSGQLGSPEVRGGFKAVPVIDTENGGRQVSGAKEVTAGDRHACALLSSGKAVCWGANSHGQLGNTKIDGPGARAVLEGERNPRPIAGVKSIVAGANSTCMILRDDSAVFCFGERFGVKKNLNWVPEKVEIEKNSGTLNEVKQIGVGRGFGCAVTKASRVFCWGRNTSNQLGLMNPSEGLSRATEVQIGYPAPGPLSGIVQISVGDSHSCAIHRNDRSVYCWGKNDQYQLGNTSTRGMTEQVALGPNNLSLKEVKEVSAGYDRSCIISMRDEVFCWGNGANGMLGAPTESSIYPTKSLDSNLEPIVSAVSISTGFDHSCMIDQRSRLYCFGLNSHGQLGSARFAGRILDKSGKIIENVSSFDTFGTRTCLVFGEKKTLGCFGSMNPEFPVKGSRGVGVSPLEIIKDGESLSGVAGVSLSANQVCVIDGSQRISCWTETDSSAVPYSPSLPSGPLKDLWQVRSQGRHGCALTQDAGEIFCWNAESSAPDKLADQAMTGEGSSKEFIQIELSKDRICGVRGSSRDLFCGSLGDGGKVLLERQKDSAGSPVRQVLALSAGGQHFCAILDSGELWCWGNNSSGQLGLKNLKETAVPTLVAFEDSRLKKLNKVSAGERHTCVANPQDPALFCFGESFFGGSHSVDPVEYPL